MKLLNFFKNIFFPSNKTKRPRTFLGRKSKHMFDKLCKQKENELGRILTVGEVKRIAINTSHITCKRRGWKGHWTRQKIRKAILNKINIDYTMR